MTRSELVLSGRSEWPLTRQWAEALHRDAPDADGLWWNSRQAARRDVIMLFGRRRGRAGGVARAEIEVVDPPLPFIAPDGFDQLCEVATTLDVTLLVD